MTSIRGARVRSVGECWPELSGASGGWFSQSDGSDFPVRQSCAVDARHVAQEFGMAGWGSLVAPGVCRSGVLPALEGY